MLRIGRDKKVNIDFALDTDFDLEQQFVVVMLINLWLTEYQGKFTLDEFMLSYFHAQGYPDWYDVYKNDVILKIA